ncbi:hypothetical protein Tco_0968040 [Tanacetum coccineum]
MESNPSQNSVCIPMVTEMHKEDQQSALGYDASANSTAKADPVKSAPSTDPHVLADQTQSVSERLETVLNQSTSDKGAINIAKQIEEVEALSTIKLENLAKLVQNVQPSFKDLDSPEDDPIIVVDDSDKDEEADKDGLHATSNIETEDDSHKLELEKNKTEAEAALLKAQSSFPNWELPAELLSMPTQVEMVQAKLKTLDALPSLLNKVTNDLNQFVQVIASKKTEDTSIPSAGQAGTQPAEEKNTNQTTHWLISWAILASSSEVPSVLEFLQRRKLEAKKVESHPEVYYNTYVHGRECVIVKEYGVSDKAKGQEVAASEFSCLNHSLSHRPVSVKPDISKPDINKASSTGGKLHILKPSCKRNGITLTPKESLSLISGSKVPNNPLTGESNLFIVKASAD